MTGRRGIRRKFKSGSSKRKSKEKQEKLTQSLVGALDKMNFADGATPDFPSDIVTEIFLRLPVRSLGRFKCVSKPWRSLISNPYFAKKHYNRNRKQQPELLFSISDYSRCCYSHDIESEIESLEPTVVEMTFRVGLRLIRFSEIWSSCDGLILLSDVLSSLYLVNLTTREFRKLPSLPFSNDSDDAVVKYGFGYDISVDDYKVVKISSMKKDIESNGGLGNVVSVYNLRTNSWRMIESSSTHVFSPTTIRNGVFVNGALHWVGLDTVIVLDLVSERFHDMPYPRFGDGVACLRGVDVSGDCLCGFEFASNRNEPFNFWVMKEYGVRDSWVRFKVDCNYTKWIVPSRTGILLIGMHGDTLAIYDPEEGEVGSFPLADLLDDAIRYEESLIGLL